MRCCLQGLSRFNEFQVALGIGKNTLSIRLKELIHDGVLTKVHASDGSKFHEYQLTEKGVELAPVILALSTWGTSGFRMSWAPLFGYTTIEAARLWVLALSTTRVKPFHPSLFSGLPGKALSPPCLRVGVSRACTLQESI